MTVVCPAPFRPDDRIVLGHGSGGQLTADLVARLFLPALGNPILSALDDAATCPLDAPAGSRLAISTDGFVVRPPFFPGGDIGRLAVCGTVNDLAVAGAVPRYLSVAFILEEGLAMEDLARIAASLRATCDEAGVTLVAADTKVVDRGKGDQVYVTTTGVGFIPPGRALSAGAVRPGDALVASGTLGDHGVAILSVREGIEFETVLESDCAPVGELAGALLAACPGVRWMRDPTRGGLAGVAHDLAGAAQLGVELEEAAIPLRDEVRAACELLGLDALHIASEGRLVAVVPADETGLALAALRAHPLGRSAAVVGRVVARDAGVVTLRSPLGGARLVTPLAGEQLPRIC